MMFGWGVDGYGRFHICLADSSARLVLFCLIDNAYLRECIEILEGQKMEMREWFGSNCNLSGSDIAKGFVSASQYEAAAHAVNCHDKLVAMLEKILAVYEMDHDDTTEVLTLVDEAKGD